MRILDDSPPLSLTPVRMLTLYVHVAVADDLLSAKAISAGTNQIKTRREVRTIVNTSGTWISSGSTNEGYSGQYIY